MEFLIGMEWDEDALFEATRTLKPFGDRVRYFERILFSFLT